jgi:RNA polymerase sigma-70 factor (family 1)
MPINFEQLVLEFQKGNAEAFKKIHEQFHEELYYFARSLVGKHEEASDIVADVFEKLWNLRSDFETFDKIRSFLFISVRNACVDYLRTQTNRVGIRKKLRRLLTDREDPFYRVEKIQEAAIRAAVVESFYQEIRQFPTQMRQIFEMRFKKNMEYAEIASELNTSVDNVRHQVAAGIRRLRKKPASRRRWLLLRMLMRY